MAAMRIEPGFEIRCVASEPVVQAPVAVTFDEDGRLWVVEMRSYMPDVFGTGEKLPSNRVSVLEDRDGDGIFETSHVFADNLMLPRGVAPCYGGALIIEPPNLVFCKDTDGDGTADSRVKLLDGFLGIENPEHAGNSLQRGLDNWYHLAQHQVDLRFDGTNITTRATPILGQWGISMDDRGRLFYTPNSTPLLFDVFPKHLGSMNPAMPSVSGLGENIAQPAAATFPIHSTPGVNRGYQDGVLRPDGTLANLTAACSPVIYRASLLGEAFRDQCFICEPAAQIIKLIHFDSPLAGERVPKGRNAFADHEFLASTDERFRPVNSCVGPDGALYICDMYRGVIQHKTYLTDYLKSQIKERNLETPLNMGRIYRIAPAGYKPAHFPKLSSLSDELLVNLLTHHDGYFRDTAQRLLIERGARVEPALRELLRHAEAWQTRLHAYWTLDGTGTLMESDVRAAMADGNAALRAAALERWDRFPNALNFDVALTAASESGDATLRAVFTAAAMRMQVAAGDLARSTEAAAILARHIEEGFAQDSLLGACKGIEGELLARLLSDVTWPTGKAQERLLQRLCSCVLRRSDQTRLNLVEIAADLGDASAAGRLIRSQIIAEIKPDADEPRVLVLAAEPTRWLATAQADPKQSQAAVYFDWPGRPSVTRPRKLRELTPDQREFFARGEKLFANCAGCHQSQGQGSPGQAATLAGSAILNGPPDRAIKALLHGLTGTYVVGDSTFTGVMPATQLTTDAEIASVLTYARRSFGNRGSPIHTGDVTHVRSMNPDRKTPWTREELGIK
jgi:mono/diheme cytochrome c family protein/glucose/arabinose dehydrogenase